ncbi:MAG TPA: hypothetical protein VGP82_05940 [Ktedonobacterales bacterium]|jgi:hypothetical protein|nr:hypothetical protein [Ktedonobacterales bacterium]
MPKQRNRQYHHAKSERRGDQLELPQQRFSLGGLPNITYPRGWVTKWPNERIPIMLVTLALIVLAIAVFMLLALRMMLLSQ